MRWSVVRLHIAWRSDWLVDETLHSRNLQTIGEQAVNQWFNSGNAVATRSYTKRVFPRRKPQTYCPLPRFTKWVCDEIVLNIFIYQFVFRHVRGIQRTGHHQFALHRGAEQDFDYINEVLLGPEASNELGVVRRPVKHMQIRTNFEI